MLLRSNKETYFYDQLWISLNNLEDFLVGGGNVATMSIKMKNKVKK